MLNSLTQALLGMHGWPVYAVVAALAFLESALFVGMVLPGETAMVLAGVLAARRNISLPALLSTAALAAVAGDQMGYLVGRVVGPRLRTTRLGRKVGQSRWDHAEQMVAAHGPWAVVGARWVAVIRALVPTVAGTMNMPYRRFLLANTFGGISWALTAVLIGYFAGGSISTAQDLLRRTSLTGFVVLTIAAVLLTLRVRRRRRQAAAHQACGSGPRLTTYRRNHGPTREPRQGRRRRRPVNDHLTAPAMTETDPRSGAVPPAGCPPRGAVTRVG